MRFANLAVWALAHVPENLVDVAILSLLLCGLTTVFIAGYYLIRVAWGYLNDHGPGARQERAAGARQAGNLALLAMVCGPAVAGSILLLILPVLSRHHDSEPLDYFRMFPVMIGVGSVAGLNRERGDL